MDEIIDKHLQVMLHQLLECNEVLKTNPNCQHTLAKEQVLDELLWGILADCTKAGYESEAVETAWRALRGVDLPEVEIID